MHLICVGVNITDLSQNSGAFWRRQLPRFGDVDSLASRHTSVSECARDIHWPALAGELVQYLGCILRSTRLGVSNRHAFSRPARLNQNDAQAGTTVMPTDS